MLPLTTPVEMPSGLPKLSQRMPLLMVGSCFATEMGLRLQEAKFDCDLNPYGVLYNPLSIASALEEMANGKGYTQEELFLYQGLWHSPMHHGDFSSTHANQVLDAINGRIAHAHARMPQLQRLVLTLGTAFVYRRKADGRVVGNCHKLPEREFVREMLSVEQAAEALSSVLTRLKTLSPELEVMLTVSPVRHLRDGLSANQLSKSTLLLAVNKLQQHFAGWVHYFPAYEIVMDELRDYRFYADDLTHPSRWTIDYVWQKLVDACFTSEAKQIAAEAEALRKALDHRPLHPDSAAYKAFLEQTMLKIERLSGKYPYLDLQNEHESCLTRLNKLQNR